METAEISSFRACSSSRSLAKLDCNRSAIALKAPDSWPNSSDDATSTRVSRRPGAHALCGVGQPANRPGRRLREGEGDENRHAYREPQ